MQPQDTYVFNFANEFKKNKKLLKIKSINNYHLCMSTCYQFNDAQESEICQKNCEIDYMNYVDFKKKTKIHNAHHIFFSPEGMFDEKDPSQQGMKQEYMRASLDMESKMKTYIQHVSRYLNDMEKKYKEAGKKK